MNKAEFLIAGGGIAGLAAALALSPRDMILLEQAGSWSEVGAGLQLGPNAVRALRKLGAWDAVEPFASSPPEIHIHDGTSGKRLARWYLGTSFENRFGAPYRVAHRADLHQALLRCAGNLSCLSLQLAHPISDFSQSSVGVSLNAAGNSFSAPSLIAADGFKSPIRQQLFPRTEPINTGNIYHRALLDSVPPVNGIAMECVNLWLYPGGHVVHYPVGKTPRLNVIAVTPESATAPGFFVAACTRLQNVIALPQSWRPWPSMFVPALPSTFRARTLLIGDAAHGTVPYLAQGAAMALEDAAILKDHPDDFEAVSRHRAARVNRLHQASVAQGNIYHASGLHRLAAHAALSCMPESLAWSRLSWLYNG